MRAKELTTASAVILMSALPATGQTWVTVTTFPNSSSDPSLVGYQIDVQSIFTRKGFTYAKGRLDFFPEVELITAECGQQRLQMGSGRVNPAPFWIKRKGGSWYFDDRGTSIYGLLLESPMKSMNKWMTAVLDFMCSR